MRFDDILKHLGDFGTYQKRVYYLVCIPIIFSAFHKLIWVFLGAVPPHRCLIPQFDVITNPVYDIPTKILNQSIPWDEKNLRWSQCEIYNVDENYSYFYGDTADRDDRLVSKCEETVYDFSQYQSTIVSEYNLVCSRNWLRAMAHSLYSIGEMVGGLAIGSASDKLGRKKVLLICLIGLSASGILVGVTKTFYAFLVFRMLVGVSAQAVILSCFVLGLEFVGPSKRVFAGIICNYFFAMAYVGMAVLAYCIRRWDYLQIAVSIPSIILCICLIWVPESARWLISVGRTEEAIAIIRKAAKVNGVKFPSLSIENIVLEQKTQKKTSPLDLIRNRTIRTTVLMVSYGWLRFAMVAPTTGTLHFRFVNSSVYYGLSLNTSNLGGNDYFNCLIAALVEFPAYTLCLFTMDYVGRRPLICISMLIGGVCLMVTLFIPIEMTALTITMAMLGKFGITASYATIFVMAAELYPTGLRNAALGLNSVSSRIGNVITSFIVLLADYWKPLPLIVLGAMSCSAGLLVLFLPETKGKTLPETVEDAENISLDEAFEDVGDFGAYQKKLYCFLLITATFPAMQRWLWDFITVPPPHRCKFPFEVNSTVSFQPDVSENGVTAYSQLALHPCRSYNVNNVNNVSDILVSNNDNTSQYCSAWIYDTSGERTLGIVPEFNLVCQRNSFILLSKKIYEWCELSGYLFWGILSDRFGRKKIFFFALILQSLSGFLAGMVASLSGVIAMRGAIGFCTAGCFIGAILRMEFIGPSMRMVTGMMDCAMASAGQILLAILVVSLSKWRHVQIVSSIPSFLFLSCWWFVPESARWLLAHKKEREARRLISKMANKNRKELTIDSYESEDEQNRRIHQSNPINLCCFSETRMRLVILIAMWLSNSIAFHCISYRWMPEMHRDRLVHFVLNALIEQPAFILCLFTLNRFGRRFPIGVAMTTTGILLAIYAVIPLDLNYLLLAILIFSKISCTTVFAGLYVYSIELQSTALRGSALGILFSCQMAGEVISLPIQYLSDIWAPLPIALVAATSGVIGFLVFLLPETTGYYMPDRLQDVEIDRNDEQEEENAFSGRRVSIYLRNPTPLFKKKELNQEDENQDFVQL
uniref:Major facilitator superfamily (MFS) profile domain-containing protein n=1 Tax=Strigamia maritima TaxID=126957 RepID=T1JAS4_STRMM